ncbi:MAG: hypothetical protein L0207_02990 [Chlamydiae bacterium]|nr:hypothetical protein [Chlamydiota bacterium]
MITMKENRSLLICIVSLFVIAILIIFPSSPSFALVTLDEMMSQDEQKQTGVTKLSPNQKKLLEKWIDDHFTKKIANNTETSTLILNIGRGKVLQLSNGFYYEIAPEDQEYSSSWLTPTAIQIKEGDDPDFPLLLKNMRTGTTVRGKKLEHL